MSKILKSKKNQITDSSWNHNSLKVFIHAKCFFLHVYALFYNLQILLLEQTLLAKCSKKLSAIKKLERKLQRGSIALLFSCVCGCVCVCVVCVCVKLELFQM